MEGRMADREFMDDRRRASEEDYFRRKDKELVEKMRQAAAAEKATSEFSAKTGLSDPVLIQELQALGFTP
jgi:DNA-binding phage protein